MKKFLLSVFMAAFTLHLVSAQSAKTTPPPKVPAPTAEQLKLKPWPWPRNAAVPPAENPFGLPRTDYRPIGPLAAPGQAAADAVETVRGENGLPIFFRGSTAVSQSADASQSIGTRALDYLASLRPVGIVQPAREFVVQRSSQDEQGNWHVRLAQAFQGVPVYGGELIAHTKNGIFELLNGRYFPTPRVASTTPSISSETAVQRVVQQLGSVKTDWNDEERQLVGGKETQVELVVYHHRHNLDAERLAWHVVIYPDLMHRKVFFVDAGTGEILHQFDHTCSINGDGCEKHEHPAPPVAVGGPVTASGLDLKNVNRSFGAWMDGVTNYLEDASQPMFNVGASQMPSSPVGAIITLNAQNTSPEVQSTFKYALVSSGSLVFSNKNAVSTHWNAIQSYKYFLSIHGRNSIDGNGGNIISFFNVSESDGTSMGNAFWNGAAMWYGNGDATFQELARGLDVGGHELTHGVIEKTANLEYQYESGALNESFADVFAVCIDTLNWKIGEDVVKAGTTPNNCLRDMQFPNNGSPSQPKHVNEQYQGTQDYGGVHINSGIPNRAFYLFATNPAVGRAKAEKVYYKALTDYLVKSSKFVDCRLAVIQAANDLYGGTVANAAATAFTTVGILGNQGGNYLGTLNPNPGLGVVVCTNNAGNKVDLYRDNGTLVGNLYTTSAGATVISRPSVSDDGGQVVFCTSDGDIVGVDLIHSPSTGFSWQSGVVSISPVWRNVAISKDGRFIAALPIGQDNRVYVEDLADILGNSRTFFLYNPTYSTGQATGEVRYADVLEFDYSGEYLMYDAFNELNNGQGENLSYWDIGFMKFWENGDFTGATPFISKLFSGLPPKSSVGNPVFSQTAPFVIAFDFIDGVENRYHVLGANIQTGDVDYLVFNNNELGWPSYTKTDGEVIFQRTAGGVRNLYQRPVAPNRIQGTGSSAILLVNGHDWGRWVAVGSRSLMVDTESPEAAALGLTASPNPATGTVQLSFAMPQSGVAQVLVSDLLGRTVQQLAPQNLPEGENRLDLDLSRLPAGTYVVHALVAGKGATLKVVKQ